MPPVRHQRLARSPLFLLVLVLACGAGDASEGATPADGAATEAPTPVATATTDGYTAADIGQGTVSLDGVVHDAFLGSCELSRMNGREDVGDLANLEGIKFVVAIDNVKSGGSPEVNFVGYPSLQFTVANGPDRLRGMLSTVAYESELTPKGTSQAVAMVAFTGATDEGVKVVARVVCEIQNKF